MPYKLATGWNVALISLVDIDPQPRTDITTQPVQRNYSASRAVHEIGLHINLQWSMIETAAQYQALLDQFGLGTFLTNSVTVYVPNYEYTFTRYNGIAIRPQQGVHVRRGDYFIRDLVIPIIDLVPTEQDAAAAITLGAVTLAATGTVAIAGAASITLGTTTLAATGTVAIAGTASITLGDTTVVGTGTVV